MRKKNSFGSTEFNAKIPGLFFRNRTNLEDLLIESSNIRDSKQLF